MKEQIEAVALKGRHLQVTGRDPLPVEPKALALAAAVRVLERYPVLDRLTLTVGGVEIGVSREEVERLLGSDVFARLREPGRWRQIVADAIRASTGEDAG